MKRRKPDLMLILALLTGAGAIATTVAQAGEPAGHGFYLDYQQAEDARMASDEATTPGLFYAERQRLQYSEVDATDLFGIAVSRMFTAPDRAHLDGDQPLSFSLRMSVDVEGSDVGLYLGRAKLRTPVRTTSSNQPFAFLGLAYAW